MLTVPCRRVLPDHWDESVLGTGVGPSGELIVVRGGRAADAFDIDVVRPGQTARTITLPDVDRPEPPRAGPRPPVFAQPLTPDSWIVVRSIAGSGTEPNARVLASSGELLRSFGLGHGVQDVQSTGDGRAWVSYFDEGILSRRGYAGHGLVRVDEWGRADVFLNELLAERGLQTATECFAINAAGGGAAYVCYDDRVSIVRVVDSRVDAVWGKLPFIWCSGIAVHGDRALLAVLQGALSLVLVDLTTRSVEPVAVTSAGASVGTLGVLPGRGSASGRGPLLYLTADQSVVVVDVRDAR